MDAYPRDRVAAGRLGGLGQREGVGVAGAGRRLPHVLVVPAPRVGEQRHRAPEQVGEQFSALAQVPDALGGGVHPQGSASLQSRRELPAPLTGCSLDPLFLRLTAPRELHRASAV